MLRVGFSCPGSLFRALLFAISPLSLAAFLQAQTDNQLYARKNSFGVIAAYSPDSSHILLGYAQNRELLHIGVSYSRRLILNHIMNWQFDVELVPVALNSDPMQVTTTTTSFPNPPETITFTQSSPTETACHPGSGSGSFPNGISYSFVSTCSRRWVPGLAFSPIGMQWDLRPFHKLQPVIEGHGGYIYTSQPIPTAQAGTFNFTFDVGAGFEFYRTHSHSYRVEYRYHHLSNHETATDNPGIDNGVIQVSWLFGR